MKKKRTNLITIGYIGFENETQIKARLLMHPLFENKEFSIIIAKDLNELLYLYRNKKIEYLIVPSRNKNDDINTVLMKLIDELNTLNLIEVGIIEGNITFKEKQSHEQVISIDGELTSFDNKYGIHTTYIENADGAQEMIEYKIFKRNSYKVKLWDKLQIILFANNTFRMFVSILSVLSTIALFVVLVLLDNVSDILEVIMTAFTLLLQLLLGLSKSAEAAERKLITGYWIYYSFVDASTTLGVVPRGFKTRLIEISNTEGELCFNCYFEGEDTLFFSTKQIAFNYDHNSRIGSGFYTYATNISNKQSKRAEGTCRFEGVAPKNNPIMMMDGWFFSRGTSLTGTVKFFRVSKEDYLMIKQSFSNASLEDNKHVSVGIYGAEYSNTDLAFKKHLSNELSNIEKLGNKVIIPHYFSSIEEMKRALDSRIVDYVVVPTSNRGTPISKNNLFTNGEKYLSLSKTVMEIKYVLASATKDLLLNENTTYYGHIESLKQCQNFINSNPIVEVCSSSHGAIILANEKKENAVCLVNLEAALSYGLFVVKDSEGNNVDPYIENEKNETTFVLYKLK